MEMQRRKPGRPRKEPPPSLIPAPPAGERRLNEHDAAALVGFAAKTLREWRYRGRGPRFEKFGRSVRYRLADLMSWLECGGRAPA
jgi:predicted DNA-binding transcriptional regulator AlpA